MLKFIENLLMIGVPNMEKNKLLIVAPLVAILLFVLSACGGASENTSTKTPEQMDKTTQKTEDSVTTDSSTTSSQSEEIDDAEESNNESQQPVKEESGDGSEADTITNAVIKATLDLESQKEDTTVDYQAKTMTQGGQTVGFEIVADPDHQEDFKVGTIKEKNDNSVNNVTLYQYKVDENNQLSLFDTTTVNDKDYESVYYVTTIGESKTNLSSGKNAATYLKSQLEANDDIEYDDMGGVLETDNVGPYYKVKLISKSMRSNGGDGTAGIYKVYQDGTYMFIN